MNDKRFWLAWLLTSAAGGIVSAGFLTAMLGVLKVFFAAVIAGDNGRYMDLPAFFRTLTFPLAVIAICGMGIQIIRLRIVWLSIHHGKASCLAIALSEIMYWLLVLVIMLGACLIPNRFTDVLWSVLFDELEIVIALAAIVGIAVGGINGLVIVKIVRRSKTIQHSLR
ncbi:MAG: hypothetical protein KAT23_03925 [Anaerolineales bacterium]|nr:hypothetical protein [Anaerolineales bacterium]